MTLAAGLPAAVALAVVAAAPAAGAPSRHVVVVGVNESLDRGVPPLSFADDDAARYAEVLGRGAETLAVLTVLDGETQPLHPEVAGVARAPTLLGLRRALAETFAAIEHEQAQGREADLVFVYVGHGAVGDDGEGYVNLLDEKLTRTRLFEEVLSQSPARFNHVIVDACSAYHLLHRGRGAVLAARRLLQKTSLKAYPHTGVLLSTSSDVETHEWSRIRGGVFSHEVLSALSGAADVDGDGALLYQEVGAFIEAANAGVKDRRARIDFYIQPPRLFLDRPVLDGARPDGPAIALGTGDEGHFVIEDARGVILAEVNKNGEQPLVVALSGEGPWRVSKDGQSWVTKPRLERPVRLAALSTAHDQDALRARSAVTEALERGLFKQPFGKSYVDGYAARLSRDGMGDDADEPGAAAPVEPGSMLPASLPVVAGFAGLGALSAAAVVVVGAVLAGGFAAYSAYGYATGVGQLDAFEAQQLQTQALLGGGGAALAAMLAVGLGAAGVGALGYWVTDDDDPPPGDGEPSP